LTGLGSLITSAPFDPVIYIIAVFIFMIMALIRKKEKSQYTYSTFVLLVIIFTILTVYQVMVYSSVKQKSTMQVLAVELSAEHDPVAEMLLKEMEESLSTDTILRELITDENLAEEKIFDYLTGKYFYGFWDRYDLQFTICRPSDSVYVKPPVDGTFHCYDFFEELVSSSGIHLPDSRFYFMDNLSGKISYLGSFEYYSTDSLSIYRMFIELDSKTISGAQGYPELLLAKEFQGTIERDYSYAKYHNNELINQSGSYSYSQRRMMRTPLS
jgi:two-component system nitrogen regulation sensor histidine kinase NtrY